MTHVASHGAAQIDPASVRGAPLPAIPATLDLAVADALRNNPQLLSARAEHEAAERNVKVAKGFLSPSLTASARFGYVEGQFIEGDESQNTVVGAQLTIPIFQGGET